MLNFEVWHVVLTAIVLLFFGGFIGGRIAILKSLTEVGEEEGHDLMAILDRTVQAVADRPSDERADHLLYLIEALDGKASAAEYRETLETLRDEIAVRLKEGAW